MPALVVGAALVLGACGGDDDTASSTPSTVKGLTLGGSDIPADIRLEGNRGVRDGQELRIEVQAKGESEIFGFEVFVCAPEATFELDIDIRPTQSGKCLSKPLSPVSDRYKEVRGAPPYDVVETTFRAGVGTDSYEMRDGTPVTIKCGPDDPCQLVLKVQYPNGFGFRAFPLDYA